MDADRPLHLAAARRSVPRAHRQIDRAGPTLRSRHRGQSRRARRSPTRSTPSARHGGSARPAPRHSDPDQGQHRHRRPHEDHGRIAGAGGLDRGAAMPSSSSGCARPARVMLGKTNLSEWANFRSTQSSSGWSGRGGQTKNPYALDRNPCGSSSGSGAAVAANLAALGDRHRDRRLDRLPVVGQRARRASSRRSGWSAARASSRSPHRRTRPVRWRAPSPTRRCSSALTGVDARDAATKASAARRADYTKVLDADGLKGARIGVARKLLRLQPGRRQVMTRRLPR